MTSFSKAMALGAVLVLAAIIAASLTAQENEDTDINFLDQGQMFNPWQPVIVTVMGPLPDGISEDAYKGILDSFEEVGAALERGRIRARREAGLLPEEE